jgi:two-component system, OmpR family, response regulator
MTRTMPTAAEPTAALLGDVELTGREAAVLEALAQDPGQVVSRELLLSRVWGYHFDPGSNLVEVYVGRLRRKLGPGWLTTVRGRGYRLDRLAVRS